MLKYFQWLKRWKNGIALSVGKYRKLEQPKISYLLEKTLLLSIICSKCKSEVKMKKIFQEEESIKILKTLGLINNIQEYQKKRIKNLDGKK